MADIKLFQVIEVIGNLIKTNVSNPSGETDWVHPTFPRKDSNLPQVTVKLLTPQYEDDSANSFLSEEEGATYKEYYYKKATALLNLYIITGKKQKYTVGESPDQLFLTNQPLNIYITEQIKNMIWVQTENNDTFQNIFERVKILGIDLAFRNSETSWASEIQCEVKYKDVWIKEYENGVLVDNYTLNIATY